MNISRRFFNTQFLRKNWIISGIMVLAVILHFYKIQEYMVFLGDEGRDALAVYNILHGHFTLLGPTASVGGFFLGPIYYYFSAPFLLITGFNPVGPSIMVAIFGVLTVFLVYKIGKEIFDEKSGIIAALLYTSSPIVLIYSRSSWNPNLMPFFTIVTLSSVYFALKKRSVKLFFLTGFLFGILMQLHYIEIFLSIIIFVYVLLYYFLNYRKEVKNSIRDYFLIFLGFIVGFSPFLLFEVRHGFRNTLNILSFILNSKDTGAGEQALTIVSNVFMRLFGGIVFNYPTSSDLSQFSPNILNIWNLFILIVSVVVVVFFINQMKRFKDNHDERFNKALLLFVWLFFGVILFGFYKKPIYDYYLEFMYPIPFLLIGIFCSYLFSKKILFKFISSSLILVIIGLSILFSRFRTEANNQLRQTKMISEFILSKTDNKPFNFALIAGGNSDHAYRYFFKLAHRDPVAIQNEQVDPSRFTVTSQLLVFCEKLPCSPEGNSLWEVAGFGQAKIIDHWRISIGEVYKLVHDGSSK